MTTSPSMSKNVPSERAANAAQAGAGPEQPEPPPGAEPTDVETNRGATTGAVPSSYGAGGSLAETADSEH